MFQEFCKIFTKVNAATMPKGVDMFETAYNVEDGEHFVNGSVQDAWEIWKAAIDYTVNV